MTEDLGMLYIEQLHLLAKVHQDSKGKFVKIPRFGKCYLEQDKKSLGEAHEK